MNTKEFYNEIVELSKIINKADERLRQLLEPNIVNSLRQYEQTYLYGAWRAIHHTSFDLNNVKQYLCRNKLT